MRIGAVAAVLAIVGIAAQQRPIAAAPVPAPSAPLSILPASVGVGLASHASISLSFAEPMDVTDFARSLQISPSAHVSLAWSLDGRRVTVTPATRWLTDERYLLTVPATARLANGSVMGAPQSYSFTTQTAPTISDFAVERVEPDPAAERLSLEAALADEPVAAPIDTADGASARTAVRIGFGAAMNRAEVERGFLITPAVNGTFTWSGTTMTFTPAQRLDPGVRYSVGIIGAHDLQGNPLGGDSWFSFTTLAAARVVKVSPANGATGVAAGTVSVWFSAPVDVGSTQRAFHLKDTATGSAVAGKLSWSEDGMTLTFKPSAALAAGHRFEVRLADGATDTDGNALTATFSFTSKAAPARVVSRPTYAAPAPSGSVQSYALSLINASRRAYGFAPLRMDAALSAVASAHAWDQIRYGYFSHFSRDGSSFHDRLDAAGISYSHAGENQCLDYGSITHALSWCHSIMMAEPYPGYWNHIANILDPRFTRVGFGYGRASDGKLIMTWDFAG